VGEGAKRLWQVRVVVPAVVLFALSLPVYYRLIGGARPDSPHTDHAHHVFLAGDIIEHGNWPARPLYHFLVILFARWRQDESLVVAAFVVMALAMAARAYLTALLLAARERPRVLAMMVLCFALTVAMPLPNWWRFIQERWPAEQQNFFGELPAAWWWGVPSIFDGQVSPNAWHSPTASIAMPFNLLLFMLALRSLAKPDVGALAAIGLVAMPLSLLGKPNYVMAFGPCFGIALAGVLVREMRSGRITLADALGRLLLTFAPIVPILAWQAQAVGEEAGDAAKLTIAPLIVWSERSRNIPASILLGIAFPLVATLLYGKRSLWSLPMALAWSTLIIAIAQFALIGASLVPVRGAAGWGMPLAHQVACGIFGWGKDFADQILFVATCDFLLQQPADWRRTASFSVLGLHVASGLFCLARCLYCPTLAGLF
jgi:hypothetical protein